MEVMMPPSSSAVTGDNFMFRSTCTSPCTPQSPQSAGNYFYSAPSSPTISSPFNRQISFAFDAIANTTQESDHTHEHSDDNIEDTPVDSAKLDHSLAKKYFSFNFHVNEDDGDDSTTKEEDFAFDFHAATKDKDDFTFDFSGQLERSIPPANQIFQGGLINSSIEPPPKKTLKNAVSFRQRKKYSDPCAKSKERVHNSSNYMNGTYGRKKSPKALNISERVDTKISCKALSLTPRSEASEQVISMERSSSSSSSWLIKWKLPDLLFRSASEGNETKKKCEMEGGNVNENLKMSSGGSGSNGGSRKKKERVSSGNELHYKVNRGTAVEMRRKTFLPYKQNLMGCMDLDSLILEPSIRGISSSQGRRQ